MSDSHGADDSVQACPECDSTEIRPRRPGKPASQPHIDTRWHCNACDTRFETPTERPSRGVFGTIPHSGLARKLWDADPDAVGGESV